MKTLDYEIRMEAESLDGKPPRLACKTCLRKINQVKAISKCRAMRNVTRCSHYVGTHEEFDIKLMFGPDYSNSLAKAGLTRK